MNHLWSRWGLLVVLPVVLVVCLRQNTKAKTFSRDFTDTTSVRFRSGDTLGVTLGSEGEVVGLDTLRNDSLARPKGMRGDSVLPLAARWRYFCDSLPQGWTALAAMLLPGSGQVINRDYWKIPIFYGGIAGFAYGAYRFDQKLRALQRMEVPLSAPLEGLQQQDRCLKVQRARNLMIAGACITYVASVADALISHSPSRQSPVAAMVSSALLPGLGQLYNRSFWKLPIIYGSLGYLISAVVSNHAQYIRYERAYVALADDDPSTVDEFNGKIPLRTLEYGANFYRRYRDLSIIGVVVVYALNIIDAYVDAHLFYWNVDDDVEVRATPQLATLNQGEGRSMVPSVLLSISF